MSVSNVVHDGRAVRLVTDTCVYAGKAPVAVNRKVTLRPSARLALTVRGRTWIGVGLAELSARWANFDAALADTLRHMPEIAALGRGAEEGFEVTLAGWQDGPRLTRLVWSRERQTVDRHDLGPGVYLAPSLGQQDLPIDLTDEKLVKVALVQQAVSRKHGLNLCIGGDVELTEIRRHGIGVELRKIGEYPDKQQMLARIATAPPQLLELAAA